MDEDSDELSWNLMDRKHNKKPVNVKRKRKKKKRVYPAEKKVVCEDCGKRFYWQCKLETHRLIHTGEKPYKCDVCSKSFNSTYSLKTHQFIHTNEKPFKCSFCAYACRDSSTLRKHQQRHLGFQQRYQCKMCDKDFCQKESLRVHVAELHLRLDVRTVPCARCGKLFKSEGVLNKHIKQVHNEDFATNCPVCGKRIKNKANLKQHLMTHQNARPYVCSHHGCDKRFKDSSSLKKHSDVHSTEVHECSRCGRRFSRASRLRRHRERVHTGRAKCVECDYCHVKFYSKNYLIKHIRQIHYKMKKKLKCDMCRFTTRNKPSLVRHIKWHMNETDRECKICHTIYKKHTYLKSHYQKTHNIVYKTKKKPLKIKEEPLDDETSIDLFEIEKEEPLDPDLEADLDWGLDLDPDRPQAIIEARPVTEEEQTDLTDKVLKGYFVNKTVKMSQKDRRLGSKYQVDTKAQEEAKTSISKILEEAGRKRARVALERAREAYNERMKTITGGEAKKETIKIKFFEDAKRIGKLKSQKIEEESQNDEKIPDSETSQKEDISQKDNNDSENNVAAESEDSETEENVPLSKYPTRKLKNNKTQKISKVNDTSPTVQNSKDNGNATESSDDNFDDDNANDKDDADYSDEEFGVKDKNKRSRKVNFNTHQCYVCFKLYPTKEELIEHCKDHFDVCNIKTLTKCPLCDYVTKVHLTRHIQLVHNIKIKVPYGRMKDKKDNTDGCRYYFEIDDPAIKKLEVIPSIKNLNRIAYVKIDRKNRENKANTMSKTKLVKKGTEWVVETEKINIDKDLILPEINNLKVDPKVGDNDAYLDGLKKLYHSTKKSGKKILFPCQHCDKICQNFAALKLHSRKHDPNKKPFKPKVWKHKQKNLQQKKTNTAEKNVKYLGKIAVNKDDVAAMNSAKDTGNRIAKPKPIKNNHKCSPELQAFYRNFIRGGDIEFWQFLKIFNKMDRENIKDFKDLEGRYDFGIGHLDKEASEVNVDIDNENANENDIAAKETHNSDVNTSEDGKNSNKTEAKVSKMPNKVDKSNLIINKRISKKHARVIRISKEEHRRRMAMKKKLRESLAQNSVI